MFPQNIMDLSDANTFPISSRWGLSDANIFSRDFKKLWFQTESSEYQKHHDIPCWKYNWEVRKCLLFMSVQFNREALRWKHNS